LFSECEAEADIVFAEVYQDIDDLKAIFLPAAPNLAGLSWVNNRENHCGRENSLHCHEIFIEVLSKIFSIWSDDRQMRRFRWFIVRFHGFWSDPVYCGYIGVVGEVVI
jgi:hypothetical protein